MPGLLFGWQLRELKLQRLFGQSLQGRFVSECGKPQKQHGNPLGLGAAGGVPRGLSEDVGNLQQRHLSEDETSNVEKHVASI